ncbi:DUF485 domain-containing protein [bacterium]|nr:DUF485 domain-containing protein [bacterium]
MLHEPAAPSGKDPASEYKKRLGVAMFIVYSVIYAGFVLINVISPLTMDLIVFLGLNLAVVYGFGLIILALILALIYNQLCGAKEAQLAEKHNGEER